MAVTRDAAGAPFRIFIAAERLREGKFSCFPFVRHFVFARRRQLATGKDHRKKGARCEVEKTNGNSPSVDALFKFLGVRFQR